MSSKTSDPIYINEDAIPGMSVFVSRIDPRDGEPDTYVIRALPKKGFSVDQSVLQQAAEKLMVAVGSVAPHIVQLDFMMDELRKFRVEAALGHGIEIGYIQARKDSNISTEVLPRILAESVDAALNGREYSYETPSAEAEKQRISQAALDPHSRYKMIESIIMDNLPDTAKIAKLKMLVDAAVVAERGRQTGGFSRSRGTDEGRPEAPDYPKVN